MSWRRARLSAADTCARVSLAARAGSGALPISSRASGASRSPDASSAAGKYSRSWWRSRCTARVRSQISVLWVRASTLMPSASGLSPAAGRSWQEPVRTMSASTCAIPGVALRAGHAMPLPVPGRLQRVHREHPAARRDQRLYPRAAVGLDPRRSPPRPLRLRPGERRPARAAGPSRPRPRAAASLPAPSRPRPSPQRRDGLPPSRHLRTAAPALPSAMPEHVSSQRENHQRTNKSVLTPPGGHDIPAAINPPGHRQGHGLPAGLNAQ